jgi:hypothetical protein
VNRSDLQQLAELRLDEARTLLGSRSFAGAYYLAGYAVECALKACVAKRVREFDFPDKRLAERSYTHNLAQLLEVSELRDELEAAIATNEQLELSWKVVIDWTEASRYNLGVNEESAQVMVAAVGHDSSGVLAWLKTYW